MTRRVATSTDRSPSASDEQPPPAPPPSSGSLPGPDAPAGPSAPVWPRAAGPPLGRALIRAAPEDFVVEETLSFRPSGAGEHLFLRVRKRGCNTQWLAQELARFAGVAPRDVGYAGLKDRHAIAVQWFSLPLADDARDWSRLDIPGACVIATARNARKLRRGAIERNRFRLRLREPTAPPAALERRLERLAIAGAPNYFGPQRFGHDAGNLGLAKALFSGHKSGGHRFGGRRLGRARRAHALSAARAWLFNAVLAERVRRGCWATLLPGDVANLDGRGSTFPVTTVDETLRERAARCELHPTGPLWGRGDPGTAAAAAALERAVVGGERCFAGGLERAGTAMARRALRVVPRELSWRFDDDGLVLEFALPSGAYATAVLRELCIAVDAPAARAQRAGSAADALRG